MLIVSKDLGCTGTFLLSPPIHFALILHLYQWQLQEFYIKKFKFNKI